MIRITDHDFCYLDQTLRYTTDVNGVVWFEADGITALLGYLPQEGAVQRFVAPPHRQAFHELSIEEEDVQTTLRSEETAGSAEMTPHPIYVSQQGLYQLSLASKSPQARPFQIWIAYELLPQIQRLLDLRKCACRLRQWNDAIVCVQSHFASLTPEFTPPKMTYRRKKLLPECVIIQTNEETTEDPYRFLRMASCDIKKGLRALRRIYPAMREVGRLPCTPYLLFMYHSMVKHFQDRNGHAIHRHAIVEKELIEIIRMAQITTTT